MCSPVECLYHTYRTAIRCIVYEGRPWSASEVSIPILYWCHMILNVFVVNLLDRIPISILLYNCLYDYRVAKRRLQRK